MSFQSEKENFIQNLVDRARGKNYDSNSTKSELTHKNMKGSEDDCPYLQNNKKAKDVTKSQNLPLQEIEDNSNLDTSASSNTLIPKSHPVIKNRFNDQDKEKCPFFKMQKKQDGKTEDTSNQNDQEQIEEKKNQEILSSSSDDENGIPKRPKGGCPFLPSERKKNPGLAHASERFSTFYLSRYSCYLEDDSMISLRRDFKRILNGKASKNRKIFDSYPIYLKHTLFHEEEFMKKVRQKEVVERFLVFDKYRERGNRLFNKQKYEEALRLYERALSCYRWLELVDSDEDEKQKEKEKKQKKNDVKQEQNETNASKCQDIFEEKKENIVTQRVAPKKEEVETDLNQHKEKSNEVQKKTLRLKKKFKEDNDDEEQKEQKNKSDDSEDECERDDEQQIKEYKNNDGMSQNKINELILSRQQDILEQERQRQMMLSKLRKSKEANGVNNSDSDDSRKLSDDDVEHAQMSNQEDDQDDETDEDKKELERIQNAQEDQADDAKSLSVEGFDDGSDRNFSSEEEEINFEKIKEQKKDPDETVIFMDEKEKQKLVAEEMFLRQNEKEDKEFRKKYRLYLTNFNDENVVLRDGDELTDSNDIDLRFSMIVNSCLSIGVCFMMLGNFKEAMQAFKDARALHKKGSIPLIRMVQCRIYNKASTYQELLEAKEWFNESLECKKEEKVFNSGPASLVVMNILNHEAFYEEIRQRLESKINSSREIEEERLREMFERVVELNEIEQDMIQRGIVPSEDELNGIEVREKEMEEELSQSIEAKYYTIIESQMFSQNTKKMENTLTELQNYYETYQVMQYYKNLDFQNYENHPIMKELAEEYKVDMLRQKNQQRFSKLKLENMKETFNSVEYNFQIYKWALDEYIEKKKKQLDKTLKKQEKQPKTKMDKAKSFISTLFGKQSIFQFFIIFIIFYFIVIILRATQIIPYSYGPVKK
ncbi:tetratricopeptide repeat protein (macronuclear) [Tetrahymena thermophila SB210]|uniref:Tetratricopeptide repeat protein n=1 Tax=Tetrahymena thermophila (strain SB210) TaxID=312017 RepID=I7LZS6_TETTS|nr:tetratricopeptide repeat protein [Tetrahymena thermophila SB210]EAR84836.1 tetratricopeptide repeat protein [Tetrahymena thermophila SB210]|eukprot:XP_001032499.1 tetratricopeptide repeat protein [Tetrahymena thermophila SB210]